MTLFDLDKTSDNRGTPKPNENDQQDQRMAHGTTQNQNSIDEAQADGLKFLERQVIAKQEGVNKAIFGFFGEANKFGLRVAEDGVDVLTAGDDELIFNSEQNVFKIVASGTIDISVPDPFTSGGSPILGSYTHNLGYRPAFQVYGDIPSGSGAYSGTGNLTNLPVIVGGGGSITVMAQAAVSTTTLTIRIINMLGANITGLGAPWSFKFYLLQETAN